MLVGASSTLVLRRDGSWGSTGFPSLGGYNFYVARDDAHAPWSGRYWDISEWSDRIETARYRSTVRDGNQATMPIVTQFGRGGLGTSNIRLGLYGSIDPNGLGWWALGSPGAVNNFAIYNPTTAAWSMWASAYNYMICAERNDGYVYSMGQPASSTPTTSSDNDRYALWRTSRYAFDNSVPFVAGTDRSVLWNPNSYYGWAAQSATVSGFDYDFVSNTFLATCWSRVDATKCKLVRLNPATGAVVQEYTLAGGLVPVSWPVCDLSGGLWVHAVTSLGTSASPNAMRGDLGSRLVRFNRTTGAVLQSTVAPSSVMNVMRRGPALGPLPPLGGFFIGALRMGNGGSF